MLELHRARATIYPSSSYISYRNHGDETAVSGVYNELAYAVPCPSPLPNFSAFQLFPSCGQVNRADNIPFQIRVTQNGIKHVLRERWYAWEDAQHLYNSGYRPEADEGSFEEETAQKA